MGRELTPQEWEEVKQARREHVKKMSRFWGMSEEEYERLYRPTAQGGQMQHEKVRAVSAMEGAVKKIFQGFFDSLKTENYQEAIDTVENIDGMSDDDFSILLAKRMSVFDEEEREAAKQMVLRRIERWQEDEPLSLREVILLDIQALIRSHNYRAKDKIE